MSLSAQEQFEFHVLARLDRGSDWSQRFPRLKPVLDRLQDAGMIVRKPAPGAKIPLMVEITDKGRNRLRILRQRKAR